MFFVFGTRYLGGVKSYNDQEIRTKFFHICFMPLFPVGGKSKLVKEAEWKVESGYDLKLNSTSILAAYSRNWMAGLSIGSFILGMYTRGTAWMGISLFFFVIAVFLMMAFKDSTVEEDEEREVMGAVTGIYAKAEWLDESLCQGQYDLMSTGYALKGFDWREEIRIGKAEMPAAVYVIALLRYTCSRNEENLKLKLDAFEMYAEAMREELEQLRKSMM
jgi:hypothetical protein